MNIEPYRNVIRWACYGIAALCLIYAVPQLFGYTWVNVTKIRPEDSLATVQAAWFQAVGSVAAIFAAIYIGRHQSREAARLLEEDRQRRTLIDGMALLFALQGVAIEASTKGRKITDVVKPANDAEAFRLLKDETWRLNSIDLLHPLYSAVGQYDARTGASLAYVFQNLLPCNITLMDTVRFFGDSPNSAQVKQIFDRLADRFLTAQQTATRGLWVLRHHPEATLQLLKPADKWDWYKGELDVSVPGWNELIEHLEAEDATDDAPQA